MDHVLKFIREKNAAIAVGESTLKSHAKTHPTDKAREYLKHMDLKKFSTSNEAEFFKHLDADTAALRSKLPDPIQHFGIARKALNTFLRDAYYNHYIRTHYRLDHCERLLETPLDGDIAEALIKHFKKETLPTWKTINDLTKEDNATYQRYARDLAVHHEVDRVHVDALLWSSEKL